MNVEYSFGRSEEVAFEILLFLPPEDLGFKPVQEGREDGDAEHTDILLFAPGSRRRGRPHTRWMDMITHDLTELGLLLPRTSDPQKRINYLTPLALERDLWHTLSSRHNEDTPGIISQLTSRRRHTILNNQLPDTTDGGAPDGTQTEEEN